VDGIGDCVGAGRRRGIFRRLRIGGYLKRGELRIGLEVGYMPFEMIDNAAGCARRRSGTAAPDAKGVN
jgi:hypothetical protein